MFSIVKKLKFLRNRKKRGFCRNSGVCAASPIGEFYITRFHEIPPKVHASSIGWKPLHRLSERERDSELLKERK